LTARSKSRTLPIQLRIPMISNPLSRRQFLTLSILMIALSESSCVGQNSAQRMAITQDGIVLSPADAQAVGKKIWQNECSGTVEGLTSWNVGDDFPSLGIGHFIWYVDGREGPFEESFPAMIAFMERQNIPGIPSWLKLAKGSPWTSRDQFLASQNDPELKALRHFLANTVAAQTAFIVQRLEQALPKMKQQTAPADRERLQRNFYAVAQSRQGVYALIDYVNFKGEGTNSNERYRGQGWGLRDARHAHRFRCCDRIWRIWKTSPAKTDQKLATRTWRATLESGLDEPLLNLPTPVLKNATWSASRRKCW